MSVLMLTFRKLRIIQEKANINMKLMELQRKLMDFQNYSASIANGFVTMNDLINCPASLFGRMVNYMQYSNAAATQGMQQKMAYMGPMYMAQMQNQPPQAQQQMQYYLQKSLYEQERERFSQVEQKLLNKEDTKIQQQIARLNTQLQMLESEEKSVDSATEKDAQSSAPKYA